jgi:hypothetical protein
LQGLGISSPVKGVGVIGIVSQGYIVMDPPHKTLYSRVVRVLSPPHPFF